MYSLLLQFSLKMSINIDMLKILIPMAGKGQRFVDSGKFSLPKPLIDVNGKPMITRVLENLGLHGQHIFIIRKEHSSQLKPLLNGFVIEVEEITQGAACTCLLAKEFI